MSEFVPVLDRIVPTTFQHILKYPLQDMATEIEDVPPMPVILGTNWYRFMSNYEYDPSDRRYWIGRNVQPDMWGGVLGGHAYVLPQHQHRDYLSWWRWYDQGQEGKCVGFACARAMTLVDRKRFDPHRIYYEAQKIDPWPGEAYSGTDVDSGVAILRRDGAAVVRAGRVGDPKLEHGIKTNRWATTVEELYSVLKWPMLERQGVFAFLNSWGPHYPHIVYMPAEVMQRLLNEYGEATMFTPN